MNEAEGDFRKLADRYRAGGNRTNLLYYLFTFTDILVGEKKAEKRKGWWPNAIRWFHRMIGHGFQQLAVFEARVRLLEGRYGEVEALLRPVLASRDSSIPEIFAAHTLGETLALEGKSEQAGSHLSRCRCNVSSDSGPQRLLCLATSIES